MKDAGTAFHKLFGRQTFATLAGDFKIRIFRIMGMLCHTASVVDGRFNEIVLSLVVVGH